MATWRHGCAYDVTLDSQETFQALFRVYIVGKAMFYHHVWRYNTHSLVLWLFYLADPLHLARDCTRECFWPDPRMPLEVKRETKKCSLCQTVGSNAKSIPSAEHTENPTELKLCLDFESAIKIGRTTCIAS